MSMNQVIQRRRRELGMTQEQVAQALNVTASAVNKWEKDATCPDVSLLAPLARLLRQLLDAAAKPWRSGDTLLFRRLDDGRPGSDMRALLGALLRNLETDPTYDFLRAEPDFQALIAERREQTKL